MVAKIAVLIMAAGWFTAAPALAASQLAWAADQRRYAQVLNTLAASVMHWYGDLVTAKGTRSDVTDEGAMQHFQIQNANAFAAYQSRYPKHLRNVVILDAALHRRPPEQFAFRVEARIFHGPSQPLRTAVLSETFVFVMPSPTTSKIVDIVREREAHETALTPLSDPAHGGALYYQLRTLAYTWLAHMDGAVGSPAPRLLSDVMRRAHFATVFGGMSFQGDVAATLQWRRDRQGHGGHLLRALTLLSRHDETGRLTIELIMNWQGKNPDGIHAVGKIRQVIDLIVSDRGVIEVINIRENHLLPDLEPWTKLLC